jgi:ferredoxin
MTMKICVDLEKCKLHGQCIIAAPELFAFEADGKLRWVEHPAENQRQAAEDAADVCPEQAIVIEG